MDHSQHRPHKVLIAGASGTGKTTYLRRFLERAPATVRFVFDHQGELARLLSVPAILSANHVVPAIASGWVCFDPALQYPGRTAEGFDWFARVAFHASQRLPGRKYWVCDEVQMFCNPQRPVPPGASLIFDTGRRCALDVAAIAQAPQRLHGDARNQLTELVCFRLSDVKARRWAMDLGLSVDPGTLGAGDYVARNLQTGVEVTGNVFGLGARPRHKKG